MKPKPGHEADLKSRTLTNLCNERPTQLENAHAELDRAVADAYGWANYSPAMPNDEIVARLFELNRERAADLFKPPNKSLAGTIQVSTRSHIDAPARKKRPGSETLERRLAVVCMLVNRLDDDPAVRQDQDGEALYLANVIQDLNLDTNYYRKSADPLDAVALYDAEIGLESLAVKHRYLSVQRTSAGSHARNGPPVGPSQ